MNLDMSRIKSQLRVLQSILDRAQSVIKNSQSRNFPYQGLNDSLRIFCAILAANARDLATAAPKQYGVALNAAGSESLADDIARFFAESAEHVGTDESSMAVARLAAVDALISTASDLVSRAERVLEQDESIGGQPLAKSPLWYK